jgi:hypothetical protein
MRTNNEGFEMVALQQASVSGTLLLAIGMLALGWVVAAALIGWPWGKGLPFVPWGKDDVHTWARYKFTTWTKWWHKEKRKPWPEFGVLVCGVLFAIVLGVAAGSAILARHLHPHFRSAWQELRHLAGKAPKADS